MTVPMWKPNPKYAAVAEGREVVAPRVEMPRRDWGFGARGARVAWTPPAGPEVPKDWWKK